MTAEVPGQGSGRAPSEAKLLETLFLSTLEEHDGLCLDNEPERLRLAAALTQVIITAVCDGSINPILLAEEQNGAGRR